VIVKVRLGASYARDRGQANRIDIPGGGKVWGCARERRIEHAGAIYHAMARGNRRGDIVLDDSDRCRFVETLEEAVEASGWVLYEWVLISKGDWRKGLVAGLIRKRSLVDNG
jgi:hypothetical protein